MSAQATSDDVLRIITKVTAKAQADPAFKAAYIKDPNKVLSEAGLSIPANVTFKVQPITSLSPEYQVNVDGVVNLVLPEVEEVVKDESLATAAAASCQSTASTAGTVSTCVSSASTASTNSCS
jgi:hypothetical protein